METSQLNPKQEMSVDGTDFEQVVHRSRLQVESFTLDGRQRTMVMPTFYPSINKPFSTAETVNQLGLSLHTKNHVSNSGPARVDSINRDIAEFFRVVNLEEVAALFAGCESKEGRDFKQVYAFGRLVVAHVLEHWVEGAEFVPENKDIIRFWREPAIGLHHLVQLDGDEIIVGNPDDNPLEVHFRGAYGDERIYTVEGDVIKGERFNLERLFRKYEPPYNLKQIDKANPDLVEHLFGVPFETLPGNLQSMFFVLPEDRNSENRHGLVPTHRLAFSMKLRHIKKDAGDSHMKSERFDKLAIIYSAVTPYGHESSPDWVIDRESSSSSH